MIKVNNQVNDKRLEVNDQVNDEVNDLRIEVNDRIQGSLTSIFLTIFHAWIATLLKYSLYDRELIYQNKLFLFCNYVSMLPSFTTSSHHLNNVTFLNFRIVTNLLGLFGLKCQFWWSGKLNNQPKIKAPGGGGIEPFFKIFQIFFVVQRSSSYLL